MRMEKNPGDIQPSTAKMSASASSGQTARWPARARNCGLGDVGVADFDDFGS